MPTGMTNWDDSAGFNTTWRWGTKQGLAPFGGGQQEKQKIRDLLPSEMAGYSPQQSSGGMSSGSNGFSNGMGGPAGGGIGTGGGVGSMDAASQFSNAAAAADPFAQQRGQYQNALQQLMQGGQSAIAADPAFQARLKQGEMGVARSQAAQGYLGSGNILTALQDYGQTQASNEFGNQYNRLAELAGVRSSSPSAAGGILAQLPGHNLQAQGQAFSQSTQSQLLPYQLQQLQNQNTQSGLETSALQNQMQRTSDAEWLAQVAQKNDAIQNRQWLGGTSAIQPTTRW